MNPNEYQKLAMRTAPDNIDWSNVGLGLSGESGEVADLIKKSVFQGHKLSKARIREELGDICWYIALACQKGGFSFEDVLAGNIEKQGIRYPDGFSPDASIHRK